MSLTVFDFRDLDLLLKIDAEVGAGGIKTAELAEALAVRDNRSVGSRLSWMRTFGMLSRDLKGAWSISPSGARVVEARIRSATGKALDALPDESMIEVMAHVTSRYAHDKTLAHMLRREFMFGTQRR